MPYLQIENFLAVALEQRWLAALSDAISIQQLK